MASKPTRDRGDSDSASGAGAPPRFPSIGRKRPARFANDNALDGRRRMGLILRRAAGWLIPLLAGAALIGAWLG